MRRHRGLPRGEWDAGQLQQMVSCVALDVLVTQRVASITHVRSIRTRPIQLDVRPRLLLAVYARIAASGEPLEYMFRIMMADEREILALHFNPEGPEARPYPHLHLGPAAEVGMRALTRAHIPTGVVSLADVVRLAVEDLGVRPRRRDWRSLVDDPGAGR